MELRLETLKVMSMNTSKIIDTDGACSEVELIEPTVAVTADIDKVRIRSPNRYGCNNDFTLFVVKEVVSENPCGTIKRCIWSWYSNEILGYGEVQARLGLE